MASSWYVVQTQVHAEIKAAINLGRQGYSVYLPRYLKHRSHARKVETVARPLFPRYLFVAIDLAAQRWRAIQSTLGVSHLVCVGDRPALVEDRVIDALKVREDRSGFIELARRPAFSPGDQVRIVDGAFVDSLALVEDVSDHDRVAVLLNLLGRKVRVFVGADLLAAS
ncbi:transcription termination/antitermination protein NusG [Bradyrhizobium elkanii]|uniref:transcription termination/antitermination protein NusG n=1 Tax=Bradyrhizobium elkanii TaxID=29448 RepID=UPI001AE931C9|nr:transcriptional activator RfaH [Bradyrhizobium elkanii]MBP2434196.1 transcriptional antiterminator RfaH [Bradyrhizobium elkanii]WLA88893.1 transcriptional activator RfaH [Bradyrhizobium elkanii]